MSGYCRVTVTGPQRWADLALPDTVPVATLLPQMVRVVAPDTAETRPGGWSLRTGTGEPLTPDMSLDTAGVREGDVLLLERVSAPARPARVEDVRGAVEDEVDESGGMWTPRTTAAFGMLLAALGPLAVLWTLTVTHPFAGNIAVAGVGALVVLAMMAVAARRSMTAVAHVLLIAAAAWGATATGLATMTVTAGTSPLTVVAFATVGALVLAALGWLVDELALSHVATLVMLAIAGAVVSGTAALVDPAQGVRALAALLALGVGVLPRVALTMGGLAGLDYEVRHSGEVATERFTDTFTASDRILLGIVLGLALATGATLGLLTVLGGTVQDFLLAGLVAWLLLLRSRLFDRIRHVLPLRVCALGGLGVAVVLLPEIAGWLGAWLPALVLAAAVACAVLSLVRLADVPRASLRRTLNVVEIVVVVALCTALAWAMGLFDVVLGLTS
ncbi:type VII secretion integral membrane protein EccD [Lipingzhangella sp. LS1_29]|uniref:Type VII secretion integral membrane protein EccD n=1 Tax=Lipingzhangella rawalii TaxID=2055835 RepID=A0ABU2H4D3_9ACTN|nr:type VII secretion integral membrane protein EccD [Lipingzhangella rawalii]MDS1270158.1 type VII secretion integral membrane protein EccD [Lipingzhangella rawalii]